MFIIPQCCPMLCSYIKNKDKKNNLFKFTRKTEEKRRLQHRNIFIIFSIHTTKPGKRLNVRYFVHTTIQTPSRRRNAFTYIILSYIENIRIQHNSKLAHFYPPYNTHINQLR